QYDLRLAIEPAPRDVYARDAREQVAEGLGVGQRERVCGEGDTRAAWKRSRVHGIRWQSGEMRQRILRRRVTRGAVRDGFGIGKDGRRGFGPPRGGYLRPRAGR